MLIYGLQSIPAISIIWSRGLWLITVWYGLVVLVNEKRFKRSASILINLSVNVAHCWVLYFGIWALCHLVYICSNIFSTLAAEIAQSFIWWFHLWWLHSSELSWFLTECRSLRPACRPLRHPDTNIRVCVTQRPRVYLTDFGVWEHTSLFVITTSFPILAFMSMMQFLEGNRETKREFWILYFCCVQMNQDQLDAHMIFVFFPIPIGTLFSAIRDAISSSVW